MIPLDSQNLESYVPVYDVAPKEWEDGRAFVVEQFKRLANAINIREIGWLLDQEVLTGKAFIPGINDVLDGGTSQQFRSVLRKVVDFGPLPNNGLKSIPHGITFDANFTLIQLWASATDPVGLFALPIVYTEVLNPAQGDIQLYMDNNNFNIITKSNRTNYTRVYVFCEYIQEL